MCRWVRYLITVVAITVPAVACSDPTDSGSDGALQVRAFARGPSEVTSVASAISAVTIDRVWIVIGRVKLEAAESGTSDFVNERSVVVELEPGDEQVLALDAEVPAGSYKELEIAIDKLEAGHPFEQSLIDAIPALRDASVLIEGTVTGRSGSEPFAFASDLDIDLEITFSPRLSIDQVTTSPRLLSLVLDLGSWFRGTSGIVLDPRNPADRSAIEGNVQKSIEMFEDPNRDGRR